MNMYQNSKELLIKHTLMGCWNEIIYCKQILDGSASEDKCSMQEKE